MDTVAEPPSKLKVTWNHKRRANYCLSRTSTEPLILYIRTEGKYEVTEKRSGTLETLSPEHEDECQSRCFI